MCLQSFAALLALLLALLTALPPLQARAAGPNDPTASGETADPNPEETDPSGTESHPPGTESDPTKEDEEEDTPAAPQINVFDPQMGYPVEDRYRNKVQFPVGRDKNGQPCIGFYAGRTHRIVPCPDCRLQPGVLNEIGNALFAFFA